MLSGFVGDGLVAVLAFLNAKGHASHFTHIAFMKDVLGEAVTRGEIAKTLRRAFDALEAPYNEAIEHLRDEAALNIDETGHREKGERFWT